VGRMLSRLRPWQYAIDAAIALGYLAITLPGAVVGLGDADPSNVPHLVVLGIYALALVVRRASPGAALGIAWVGAIVQISADVYPNLFNAAVLVVVYSTAASGGRIVRWLGLASVALGAIVASCYFLLRDEFIGGADVFAWSGLPTVVLQFGVSSATFVTVIGLPWLFGLLVRAVMRARESGRAREAAERDVALEQERNRIARDMHDIVAHSLAVVIAQADGARYAAKADPTAVDTALTTIAGTAREALADVRVMLNQLRHSQDGGPQPGIADVEKLVEQVRGSGLDVRAATDGIAGGLGAARELAVYRIVQEALTNALRHGDRAEPVHLRMQWLATELRVEVRNAVPTAPHGAHRPGHGLAGMRERAALVGGAVELTADGGVFRVRLAVPITRTAPIPIQRAAAANAPAAVIAESSAP
jgi:signal transduction histidine kinase